jgi:hypothetical protein
LDCLLGIAGLCVEAGGVVAFVVFEAIDFLPYGVEVAFALSQNLFGELRSVGLPLISE